MTCATGHQGRRRDGGNGSVDLTEGQKLLDLIAEIDTIFWETKKRRSKHDAIRVVRVADSDLARITTDNPTKQGNPGKPQSFYQRFAAHLDGPDEVAESAPI